MAIETLKPQYSLQPIGSLARRSGYYESFDTLVQNLGLSKSGLVLQIDDKKLTIGRDGISITSNATALVGYGEYKNSTPVSRGALSSGARELAFEVTKKGKNFDMSA